MIGGVAIGLMPTAAWAQQNPFIRPTPEEILADCQAQLDELLVLTQERLDAVVAHTEHRLEVQGQRGKPDKVLDRAARRGKKRARNLARGTNARLNRIRGQCQINIHRFGGTPDDSIAVFQMARQFVDDLSSQLDAARTAIDDARASVIVVPRVTAPRSNDAQHQFRHDDTESGFHLRIHIGSGFGGGLHIHGSF